MCKVESKRTCMTTLIPQRCGRGSKTRGISVKPFLLNPMSDDIIRISLLAAGDNSTVIFTAIACMCLNRSADKANAHENSHKTCNGSGTQARVTPAQGWSRIRARQR
ncbi:hypothetical protein QQF64_012710 [Cirrhinus molitorella]|uniref:Uncharacterized protein n=1 Tax=Cirrhinus molitorella TaxID=172907 RepID=A0ABR3LWA0_9TELE